MIGMFLCRTSAAEATTQSSKMKVKFITNAGVSLGWKEISSAQAEISVLHKQFQSIVSE